MTSSSTPRAASSYVALIEASDPEDIAQCPNPHVTATVLPRGIVRLVGEYDDLMAVLTDFVGMTLAEADTYIEELV